MTSNKCRGGRKNINDRRSLTRNERHLPESRPMDCPLLINGLKKPIIYWYQTDVEVVTRIMLHDVEDYFLRVTTDEFEFSATANDVDYYVNLHLFGAVIAENTTHTSTGREITVHIPKVHRWTAWPRLLYSQTKSPQIFVDTDRLESIQKLKKELPPDWSENDFSNYKKKNFISQIMPDVPSSGEDDSADDDYNAIFEY